MLQVRHMESTPRTKSGTLDMYSPETVRLFSTLQDATKQVEGGASRLGLLDLVTVGQVRHASSCFLCVM